VKVRTATLPLAIPRITTSPRPVCYVCGERGVPLYEALDDHLFGVQGEWNFLQCPNQDCSLVWLDPMPAEHDLGKLYANYYTHEHVGTSTSPLPVQLAEGMRSAYCAAKYSASATQAWYGKALSILARLSPGIRAQWDFSVFCLPAHENGKILDVGCGSGRSMKRLAALGWQVQGLDFDPKAVNAARDQGLHVSLGTIDDQDFADGFFDAVVMSHVLEHVPDPRKLLESCRRILKLGGHLVSVTPNASSWGHRRYGQFWRGLEPPRHLHIFTPMAIERLAGELAFSHYEVSSVAASAHAILWSSKELKDTGTVSPYEFSVRSSVWGRAMQLAEWFRIRTHPHAGEEIVLHAVK
jgi:2-polyprenyl-3-methyl-5-hydroxy-6-metoxy-1,4-benzoquinol methylase